MKKKEKNNPKKQKSAVSQSPAQNGPTRFLTFLTMQSNAANLPVSALKIVHLPGTNDSGLSQNITHGHDFYELIIVMQGKGIHICNGIETELYPGVVTLLRPETDWHFYRYSDKLVLLNFMFKPSVLEPWQECLQKIPGYKNIFEGITFSNQCLSSAQIAELDILQDAINRENATASVGSELFVTIKLLDALLLIIRNIHDSSDTSHINSILGVATSYMMHNFHEQISIKQLSKLCNLSESSFFRKFQAEFHESPCKWLLKYRLRKSMEFLLRSDMQIQDIAMATGFKDPFYFSRKFRSLTGCSPQQFRRRNHGRINVFFGNEKWVKTGEFMQLN